MESQYGIGITNRYALFLNNEDDPVEVLKTADPDKDKKKGKIAEKENRGKESGDNAPTQKTATNAASVPAARKGIRDSNKSGPDANKQAINKPANNGVGRPNRVPRPPPGDQDRNVKFNEEGREDRNNRKNLSREDSGREPRPEGEFGRGGARRPGGQFGTRPRGAGGDRGRGRGAPGGPGRKREFDRQSGSDKSGVKAVDKRDGAGSRNWGTYKDDIEEVSGTPANPDETMEEKTDAQPPATETTESPEEKTEPTETENAEPPVEEGPKLMTLDEWKALQQPRQKPVFNLRKAGEGEDQTQWKKMILKKKEKEQAEANEEEEYEEDEQYDCPQRAGRQKQVLEIDFHFADSRRGGGTRGGGRGGRGGGRGDGGERRDRGPRPPRNPDGNNSNAGPGPGAGPGAGTGTGRGAGAGTGTGGFKNTRGRFGNRNDAPRSQTAPKVDDVNDFPSLG